MNEKRTIIALLVLLLVVEIAVRMGSGMLSIDDDHIHNVPRILSEHSLLSRPRVLFIGNSLTRSGINVNLLTRELRNAGFDQASVTAVFPDDTVPIHWCYIIRNYIQTLQSKPDLIVMGVADFHLFDSTPLRLRKLGCSWCNLSDIPRLVSEENLSFDESAEVLAAWGMWSFAKQDRIKKRVLNQILPNFRITYQALNDMIKTTELEQQSMPSFNRLARYERFYRDEQIPVVYIGMPTRRGWDIPGEFLTLVQRDEIRFIDSRIVEGLEHHHFRDSAHLTDAGATVFSKALAEKLIGHMIQHHIGSNL